MIELKYISKRMLLLSFSYLLLIITFSIVRVSRGTGNSLFDYILNMRWGGSASLVTLTIGIIPILSISIPLIMDRLENEMIITRIRWKRKLFYGHFAFFFLISGFLTILITVSGVIGSLIATGQAQNLWGTKKGMIYFLLDNKAYFSFYPPHVTSFKVWVYLLSSRFLAILFITTFIFLLKLILKKNVYVFFTSLVFLGTDGLHINHFSLFLGRARITLETWISPEDQIFNIIYFILMIIVFYFLCKKIYDRKEYYH
ncbi:hypothetical protein EV207_10740 [Scopulibacillus darangshiensis]|uniref:ABC-2 type transport system permease protein n=1 Tax=Scopulibacillus darangshiensis TaxID=442528 RepID=A0A4V2SN62_9BACL|nr:hypothetical protein [Scopulibacillus darangshiensis]TCP29946.1 hypothetical protein EV207_10740 [Scopulibacillus darangshiensis]